jgi:hypothetical protein
MTIRFKNLKESLRDLEEESGLGEHHYTAQSGNKSASRKAVQYILLGAFIISFFMFAGKKYDISVLEPLQGITQSISFPQYGAGLLDSMGEMLVDMGYESLSRDELTELRREGVTATYVMRVRGLGYDELTLDEAVRLQRAGVSSTYIAMMQELGYSGLTIDDLIRLRRNNVTAHFTSNMHDLGFQDLGIEELIRLREIGVSVSLVERLLGQSENELTLEEIIRYRISNQ